MSIVHLNVGGIRYSTSATTLNRDPSSMLAAMLNQENERNLISRGEELFIDRNGKMFEYILDFLRDGPTDLNLPQEKTILAKLDKETDFFQLNDFNFVIKQKLADLDAKENEKFKQTNFPPFRVGSMVQFTHRATTLVVLQDLLKCLQDNKLAEVTFENRTRLHLEPIECWICGDPLAQSAPNFDFYRVDDQNQNHSYRTEFEAVLTGLVGIIVTMSETCCMVKFNYTDYASAVGLIRSNRGNFISFEVKSLGYINLHVPISFLKKF